MLNKITYSERPEAIIYCALPDGEADIWLRRGIAETTQTDEEGNVTPAYEAEEAFMRTTAEEAEVAKNFDIFFDYAAKWDPSEWQRRQHEPTSAERIAALEKQNNELAAAIVDTELALCELFESMEGVI